MPGTLIGSEEQLSAETGVSAPTLRQAARLLEFEGLLRIKRGSGGGYYASRPSMDAVIHIAGTYLGATERRQNDSVEVAKPLSELLARLAARCADEGLRESLRAFSGVPVEGPDAELQRERELYRVLALMSGNTVLQMFFAIFNYYGEILEDLDLGIHRAAFTTFVAMRAELIDQVLAGEAEQAALTAVVRIGIFFGMVGSKSAFLPGGGEPHP